MPMRPAELGTVRLMNLIADCRTTHGRRASGAATAPRTEMPDPIRAHWATISATTTQASISLAQLMGDGAEADFRQLADQQVRGEDQCRHQQEVLGPNAAHGRDLRGPPCRSRRRRLLEDP